MSSETPAVSKESTEEVTQQSNEDRRLEDAGSTPLPDKEDSLEKGDDQVKADETVSAEAPKEPTGTEEPAKDNLQSAPPATVESQSFVFNNTREGLTQQQSQLPLSLNKLAIFASAQNKLPVSKVKGIVLRLGRHTESSVQKSGKWYKNDNYVDKDSYTWRNMPLFEDHQTHLWTSEGTVRGSCKK